jgi:hypothetical protein
MLSNSNNVLIKSYIDADSIYKQGNKIKCWLRNKIINGGDLIELRLINIKDKTHKLIYLSSLDKNGNVISSVSFNENEALIGYVRPGTISEAIYEAAIKYSR